MKRILYMLITILLLANIVSAYLLYNNQIELNKSNAKVTSRDATIESYKKTVQSKDDMFKIDISYRNDVAQTLFTKTNDYRISKGVKPLQRNLLLDASACSKANDMNNKQYFAHYSPDGKSPFDFISEYYPRGKQGENLEYDSTNPFESFKNSPGHEKNMTDSEFTQTGICVIYAMLPDCPKLDQYNDPIGECNGKKGLRSLVVVHFAS